jgi:hypothetical protein
MPEEHRRNFFCRGLASARNSDGELPLVTGRQKLEPWKGRFVLRRVPLLDTGWSALHSWRDSAFFDAAEQQSSLRWKLWPCKGPFCFLFFFSFFLSFSRPAGRRCCRSLAESVAVWLVEQTFTCRQRNHELCWHVGGLQLYTLASGPGTNQCPLEF